jgi:hypothetical protein
VTKTLGPDGKFARGKPLREGDLGGVYAGFGVLKEHRIVVMDFATTLKWVAMPPEHAVQHAAHFRKEIQAAFGEMTYDPSTFPLIVRANKSANIIETFFPQPVGILAANPEVFLVWADKLDAAAKELDYPQHPVEKP